MAVLGNIALVHSQRLSEIRNESRTGFRIPWRVRSVAYLATQLFDWSLPQEINFDTPRGGISLVTERGPVTTSRLLIQRATKEDSGLYTCSPSNTLPYSARVHIVNGKGERRSSFLRAAVSSGKPSAPLLTSLPVAPLPRRQRTLASCSAAAVGTRGGGTRRSISRSLTSCFSHTDATRAMQPLLGRLRRKLSARSLLRFFRDRNGSPAFNLLIARDWRLV